MDPLRPVFSVEERHRARERVLELASSDPRVVAAAVVGSLAHGPGDRWSDLDLTFAVADEASVHDVIRDWTRDLVDGFDAIHLFDLSSQPAIYRVFLLPGCLQVDLSFTSASEFWARGPSFRLLFGGALEAPHDAAGSSAASARHLFGLGVHHAVRARVCIERGRHWQAEHWITGIREYVLSLACLRHGLNASHGRGFDDLPADELRLLDEALVRLVEREELLRALGAAVAGLLRESAEVHEAGVRMEGQLRSLTSAWS